MRHGYRTLTNFLGGIVAASVLAGGVDLSAQKPGSPVTVELGSSYAEWKQPGALIVDGQKVVVNAASKWKGKFKSLDAVPLGEEVRVKGVRLPNGDVLALEIDVRANGTALFEPEVQQGTNPLDPTDYPSQGCRAHKLYLPWTASAGQLGPGGGPAPDGAAFTQPAVGLAACRVTRGY